jgi:hypothetical protein
LFVVALYEALIAIGIELIAPFLPAHHWIEILGIEIAVGLTATRARIFEWDWLGASTPPLPLQD